MNDELPPDPFAAQELPMPAEVTEFQVALRSVRLDTGLHKVQLTLFTVIGKLDFFLTPDNAETLSEGLVAQAGMTRTNESRPGLWTP